jgi:translation initiation factor 2B subunit (eIF-2B alpha/beta/delta family)
MTHLSPQITHLVTARPMSVTMGNAIRQLKLEISGSDIDMVEQDVGRILCFLGRSFDIPHRLKMHSVTKLTIIFGTESYSQMK